jgi:hypothetical protein
VWPISQSGTDARSDSRAYRHADSDPRFHTSTYRHAESDPRSHTSTYSHANSAADAYTRPKSFRQPFSQLKSDFYAYSALSPPPSPQANALTPMAEPVLNTGLLAPPPVTP